MPEVLDWQRGDPRLVLQRAVQELTAGRLVVFPTETGYHVAAAALQPEGLTALGQIGLVENAVLAVRDLTDARHWVPGLSITGRRLARRVWPGPVTLVVDCQTTAEITKGLGATEGMIRLRVPAHDAPLAVLEHLGGPLVLVPAPTGIASGAELAVVLGDNVSIVIDDGPANGFMAATVVQVRGSEWNVTQAGTITAAMLQNLMRTTVLFICTGNTCRSPMAEALCKKLLAERIDCRPEELAERGFLVLSAGLAAMMGMAASPEAVDVLREYGADLSGHRSQPLTADLLARADHLFAMTKSHLSALVPFCEESGPQPRLLAGDAQDVPDPIGAEPQVYRECAQQILRYLQDCLPEIKPL